MWETIPLLFCMPLSKNFLNCINCKPSLPIQFLIIGTLFSSVNWYVLDWSMLITSILKLNKSTYQSRAFQLKEGCFWAGLCFFFLWASSMHTVFAPDIGPASATVITITADWIASGSAISSWLFIIFCFYYSDYICLFETFTPDTV